MWYMYFFLPWFLPHNSDLPTLILGQKTPFIPEGLGPMPWGEECCSEKPRRIWTYRPCWIPQPCSLLAVTSVQWGLHRTQIRRPTRQLNVRRFLDKTAFGEGKEALCAFSHIIPYAPLFWILCTIFYIKTVNVNVSWVLWVAPGK